MPDHPLPARMYEFAAATPGTVLLEGAAGEELDRNEEPWTRVFTAPLRICVAREAADVPGLFAQIEQAVDAGLCAAGFFSYECGAAFEPKAGVRLPRPGQPLAWFGIYEHACRFHHPSGEFEGGSPPGLGTMRGQLSAVPELAAVEASAIEAEFSLTAADYTRRIEAIHEWIRSGDIYQLNFTAPLNVRGGADAAAFYARLRTRQPSRFGALVHWELERRILSFSPELFFRVESCGETRRIVTRPMKGTAPRGRTADEDRAQAEWLGNDPKNRAENLMIVDLLRSDLGRIARTGSVRAEALFELEPLPALWQMTSTVSAELRDEVNFHAIFRALFPSGSITGAPKVRAMQLISALEDEPRGVYTGAIGFFSREQTVFNVAIRTLAMNGDCATMGVGGGIVIDSEPLSEYRECLLKAAFLGDVKEPPPERFSLIETLLWDREYPLLELHMDRLTNSARHFGFPCRRAEVESLLSEYATPFKAGTRQRVRLLLAPDGSIRIEHQPLEEPDAPAKTLRVSVARERTDPADPMLYHKTTNRPLYGPAFEAAVRMGYADVLFFNRAGELTEGAISNVFIEKNGRWATPAIECGVLAGVFRRHLLAARPEIEERRLYEADLRNADAVYLANAVRALRRVEIDWVGPGPSSEPATLL